VETLSFPKERRLRSTFEFQKVREKSNKLFSKSLLIYYLDNNLTYPRLGVIVSKKVSKKAVVRNRIKRQIREIFRLNQNKISPIDLVVIAKQSAEESNYQQIESNLMKALSYAKKLSQEVKK
jgi:ribonuclease P protein component